MNRIVIGQRYMSIAEPELGLGIIVNVKDKFIEASFPLSNELRKYGIRTAPLKRIQFEIGDQISSNDGLSFLVTQITKSESGLNVYLGERNDDLIIECDLLNSISFHRPEEKLLNSQADSSSLFQLRYNTLKYRHWLATNEVRGLIGARLSLIGHQYYLADKVTKRAYPRVLLADEVGLGKTIETGLILHKLILTGRAQRVLIVTPASLNFQWFIEMLRKYNLVFSVVNEQTNLEPDTNPFDENNLVVTSMELLCSSKRAKDFVDESKWDILVVDEAHKLHWRKSKPSPQYSVIEELSKKINGLLLLSATPEIFGVEGHFSHLKLIDPDRFYDLDKYIEDEKNLKEYAKKGRELIANNNLTSSDSEISELIDKHGPGRVFFRNTREIIDKKHKYFPDRVLKEYLIENDEYLNLGNDTKVYKKKINWLVGFLEKNRNKKILLICHSKEKVLRLEKDINRLSGSNKVGVFHESLSLMARDRQAAYFREDDGSNILICSEIGSEGRNFQFCQNLILLDLPLFPDLLEQRIGRLDRIGQEDKIIIHVPFVKNTWEQILFTWYNSVFSSFTNTLKGNAQIAEMYKDRINYALNNVKEFISENKLKELVRDGYQSSCALNLKLQEGRDVLIELNSFNQSKAELLVKKVIEIDKSTELREYLESVYSHFGVDVDDLDSNSQFIRPSDNMFIPHFPHLTKDGFSYTFDRQVALEREELSFMSWDHPMVTGIIELISGEEFGNSTLMTISNGKVNPFLEVFYLIESMAPKSYEIGRFLPPTVVRVFIDLKGNDFTEKWTKELLDEKLVNASGEIANIVSSIPNKKIKDLLTITKSIAVKKKERIVESSSLLASEFYEKEIDRLISLQKINSGVSDKEIEILLQKKLDIDQYIKSSGINIDSIRFIY